MSVEPNILVSLDAFIIIGIWRELDFRNSWTSSLSIQYQTQCSQGLSKVALQILHVQWGTINKVVFQCNFWNVSTSLTVLSVTYNFEQNIFQIAILICLETIVNITYLMKYCMRAIINNGLYIFYPLFGDHFFTFEDVFFRKFCPYLWLVFTSGL